ncbi:MAG: DUF72 domain-containing protein [Burkholderiales bacterium]|nr:DUF72 domain-containing protein [Burkholderiales bacterium]MDP2398687.1 DUF72 domain-containing protein [Burkholderiales bacterium]
MARQLSLFEGNSRGSATRRAVSVAAAEVAPEVRDLARQLPRGLRLGTSSWHFPGWRGVVWADTLLPADLARNGLSAYAQHPLFAATGIDRTFQSPLTARQYGSYAAQVPDHFRFVVRAPGTVTGPWHHGEDGGRGGPNTHFLDASYAIKQFIEPAIEGLGTTAGPLLFQFPPLGRTLTRSPERFIARLHDFLEKLPRGPLYAVEMRDARMITRRFFASLKDAGARYCVGVHSRMPAVATQAAAMSGFGPGPLLVRWSLRAGYSDEEATSRFAPFDRLVDEDAATRESIARLCSATLAAGEECTIIAGNKAEGSAPLTLIRLAQAIVAAVRERRLAAGT